MHLCCFVCVAEHVYSVGKMQKEKKGEKQQQSQVLHCVGMWGFYPPHC